MNKSFFRKYRFWIPALAILLILLILWMLLYKPYGQMAGESQDPTSSFTPDATESDNSVGSADDPDFSDDSGFSAADNNSEATGSTPRPAVTGTFEDYLASSGFTMTARIVEVDDTRLLIARIDENSSSHDIFTINVKDVPIFLTDGTVALPQVLDTDMIIEIAYDGGIMESYPGQFHADAIRISAIEASLIDMYMDVIEDFYEEDPALNADITMIGVNFSQLQNLTETEKNALIYLIEQEYGLPVVSGTFQELCDAGYIDEENLYWEDGVLFELSDTPIADGTPLAGNLFGKKTFTFSVRKWRSGLGAIGSSDCKAELDADDDEWEYEFGGMWIS